MIDSSITLRTATLADVPTILAFIRELAEYERLSHEVVATQELLEQQLFSIPPRAEVIIAQYHNEPVGFALYFHSFSTFVGRPGLYLEDLYVRPSMRGKGIGRSLLQRLAQIALERGCARLEWSVLDWNEPAIGFYKSVGAVPMSDWTVYRMTGEALQTLARA